MEYGINAKVFAGVLGLEKTAELVAAAGFTKLDYTPPLLSDDWETVMKNDVAVFAAHGLTVHQTHAPFNRYGRYGSEHKKYMDRCAEATAYTGAAFMVIHGDEFDFENMTFTPEAALAYNHDYFLPYVEAAAKSGYKTAFETVFEDSKSRRRFTSDAAELKALITSFDSESAVCCWDFGHGNVSFKKEAPAVIRDFASLIQCTHLHDNKGQDTHNLPMTGNIDWNETMAAFREIGFDGVLSIEYGQSNLPADLLARYIELTGMVTKYLGEL